jgi:hypothetical protein
LRLHLFAYPPVSKGWQKGNAPLPARDFPSSGGAAGTVSRRLPGKLAKDLPNGHLEAAIKPLLVPLVKQTSQGVIRG